MSTTATTAASDFKVGARVRWAGDDFTVWAMHPKAGWRWISREGKPAIPVRVSNLELLDAAPTAAEAAVAHRPRSHAAVTNPFAERDRQRIRDAIRADADAHDGVVSPNRVRARLEGEHGLTVRARALSSAYSHLAASGVLQSLGWEATNDDIRSGNAGKPMRLWKLVGAL